jgi:tRNA splicing ligase
MKLGEYLDEAKLAQYVNRGLVTARHHNTLPLTIYCYSKKAVYSNHWDDITTKTRGLIVSKEGDIIARPYEKFFSIGQPTGLYIPDVTLSGVLDIDKQYGPPIVTEKVNGHLGIFWRYGTHWGVATKGSFHSSQAEWATKWLEDHVEHKCKLVFPEGYTPIFEIICQDIQPHTIKYDKDELVLLDFVKTDTGEELGRDEFTNYAIKNSLGYRVTFPCSLEQALTDDDSSFEGYVVTYNKPQQAPFKLKVKFPTFIENRRKFYAAQKMESLKSETPVVLDTKAKDIVKEALVHCTTRKEFAEYFNRPENKQYSAECFKLLDYDNKYTPGHCSLGDTK